MARLLVSDALWSRIEPLAPPRAPQPNGGRPWCSNRAALTGIVLRTGIPCGDLPQERGCSGMTCWRRLRDWQQAGVWEQLQHHLLAELGTKGRIDGSRAASDASSVPAKKSTKTGSNPTDRGKAGSKHHSVTDARGGRWPSP